MSFYLNRPQIAKVGDDLSSSTNLSTASPKVVFSILVCIHSLPTIVQPATTVSTCKVDQDDTTAVDISTHSDVTQHCDQVHKPAIWCNEDNLELNVEM